MSERNRRGTQSDPPGEPAPSARNRHLLQQRHLLALVAIADAGSVHRAAQQLGVPQPALSRQLAEAEQLLGCRLFERSSQGTQPSAAGLAVLPRCRLLVRMLEGMRDISQDKVPQILLGCVPRAMHALIPAMLGRWQPLRDERGPAQPLLRVVESDSGSLWEQLVSGQVDFAVLREQPRAPIDQQQLLVEKLYDDHTAVICAAGHPALGAGRHPLRNLLRQGWALPQRTRTSRQLLDRLLAEHGLPPIQPVIEARSFESLIDIVACTHLLSIAPLSVAQRHAGPHRLRVLDVVPAMPPIPLSIACHRNVLEDPWMRTFWEELRRAASVVEQRPGAPTRRRRGSPAKGPE